MPHYIPRHTHTHGKLSNIMANEVYVNLYLSVYYTSATAWRPAAAQRCKDIICVVYLCI